MQLLEVKNETGLPQDFLNTLTPMRRSASSCRPSRPIDQRANAPTTAVSAIEMQSSSYLCDHPPIKAGKVVIAKNPNVLPIFSLGHLAHLSGAPYRYLREIIERQYDPYSIFTVRKRNVKSGFRTICVPPPPLMQLQRWLVDQVLNQGSPHTASTAFAPESSILDAAEPHVGSSWLIKVDIRNFFESISEIAAYRVFHEQFGFQELVSFEMARLCTRKGPSSAFRSRVRSHRSRYTKIPSYQTSKMGHLPQGAPTSPMLANLSVRAMDEGFQTLAESEGLIYTRYADDLFFSTTGLKYTRRDAGVLITKIYRELRTHGFSPNTSKTTVSPPGARKLVVGLAVDGDRPRLRREFKQSLRLHLHHCKRDVAAHAKARKFTAIAGLQNYLQGLLSYAKQIEPEYRTYAEGVRRDQLADLKAQAYRYQEIPYIARTM